MSNFDFDHQAKAIRADRVQALAARAADGDVFSAHLPPMKLDTLAGGRLFDLIKDLTWVIHWPIEGTTDHLTTLEMLLFLWMADRTRDAKRKKAAGVVFNLDVRGLRHDHVIRQLIGSIHFETDRTPRLN